MQEAGHATTCGELRARFWRGDKLLNTGGPGVAALFTGNDPTLESNFGSSTLTAAQYNALWTTWGGFLLRPDNFDDLVAERYGSVFGGTANPYPKPFENPNTTNGGTGRLPEMFTQLRNPTAPGAARSASPVTPVTAASANGHHHLRRRQQPRRPASPAARCGAARLSAVARFLANLTRTRGTNNASDINLAFLFPAGPCRSTSRSGSSPRARRPRWTRPPGGTWATAR